MPVGTVTLAPVTNRRLTWRTRAVCSASGPTMIPGVSHRKSSGQVEGVAQLHEAGRLVGPVGVDGARPGAAGCWRSTPIGRPSTRISAVTMPEAEVPAAARAPSRRRRCASTAARTSYTCRRFSGITSRAASGGGRGPRRRSGPGSRRGTAGRRATAAASSGTATSTTPLGTWTSSGPIASGGNDAEAAALDHRRAAHADVRALGGDHDVAAPEQGGVAGEAATAGDADQRHQPRELAEQVEGEAVEARHAGAVRVPRTTRRLPR